MTVDRYLEAAERLPSFGSWPSRSWSRVSFLIAISALRRRHYGPAQKIPDSSVQAHRAVPHSCSSGLGVTAFIPVNLHRDLATSGSRGAFTGTRIM